MASPRTTDFSSGSIIRHLISFSVPMLLGNLFQALYNTVDSFWVGRFLGKEALAAVSVGFPVIFLLVAFVTGLTMAATTLVAQYAGARQGEMVRRTVANTMGLLVLAGIVLSVLGVVFHRSLLRLIQTPPSIMPLASAYLSIYLVGLVFTFIYNASASILRGLGDSRSPTLFLVYATIANIILDPLFIFGPGPFPRLGVTGAAWATVIAQALAAVLAIRHLYTVNRLLPLSLPAYRPRADLTLRTVSIGLPAGIQQTIVSLGALVLNALVNSFGPTVTAAFGAAGRLDQFSFLPTMSLSLATSALVGQNLGAGMEERAHETLRWSAILASSITGGVMILLLLFPRPLLAIFTKDAEVLAEGTRYLRTVSLGYVPFSVMFSINGLLRGAGDTFPTMVTSLISLWLVRLPLATWFARGMGLGSRGIWIGMAISPLAGLAMSYLYYRSGRWRRKVVVKKERPVLAPE
ncbi:MAG: MATE family efflux transporter [Firmicutes bacterium]|nr:MATE family efflux transporter [Bacillota bacterium]